MLRSLIIKDFILIEKLELDFDSGFVVITGETGAGKSILLDAIMFAFGENNSSNVIRSGAEFCSAILYIAQNNNIVSYLKSHDIEFIEGEDIIIKTTQNLAFKKKLFINDQPVTSKMIKGLFDHCFEINGQHNHTNLLNVSKHLEILDEYGQFSILSDEVSQIYHKWQGLEREILEVSAKKEIILEEIDYLSHIVQELKKADIKQGEEEELSNQKQKLQNKDNEIKIIKDILSHLEGSDMGPFIAKSQRSISKSINNFDNIMLLFESAYDQVEDAKTELEEMLRNFEVEEYGLAEVDDRLYEIRDLARKHSCQPCELMVFLDDAENKLNSLQGKILNIDHLVIESKTAEQNYLAKSNILSNERKKVALKLSAETSKEMALLEMKKAIFKVEVINEGKVSPTGLDKVRFIASTNPGNPAMPIDKIASGGELSRFMLALRLALFAQTNSIRSVIFDEIDVGISGAVADSIGDRLKCLGEYVQTIVITHQPQVAGKANQHILVSKTQYESHTEVEVSSLDQSSKIKELARMISGRNITGASLIAAKELMS